MKLTELMNGNVNVNVDFFFFFYVSGFPRCATRGRALPGLDASRALLLRLGLARAAAAPEVTELASSPDLFRGN